MSNEKQPDINSSDNSDNNDNSEIDFKINLGDIIEVYAPTNPDINKHTFFVKYIDDNQLDLINVDDLNELVLTIKENGLFNDESIESIHIMSRDENNGYAKQNNLLPGNWLDLHFGGDIPTILTGFITNLEEDMIEIKLYPDDEIIYVDFGYKGIPKDIPLHEILIRDPPETIKELEQERLDSNQLDMASMDDLEEYTGDDKVEVEIPQVKEQIKEIILGRKHNLIAQKFKVAGHIRIFIENMEW